MSQLDVSRFRTGDEEVLVLGLNQWGQMFQLLANGIQLIASQEVTFLPAWVLSFLSQGRFDLGLECMFQHNRLGLCGLTQQLSRGQQLRANGLADRITHRLDEQVSHVRTDVADVVGIQCQVHRIKGLRLFLRRIGLEEQRAVLLGSDLGIGQFGVGINKPSKLGFCISLRSRLRTEHGHGQIGLTGCPSLGHLAHAFVQGIDQCLGQLGCNTPGTRTVNGNGQWVLGNAPFQRQHTVLEGQVFAKEHVHQV
ncbi:hypothetical protein D3C86_1288090 [compost metagenome]